MTDIGILCVLSTAALCTRDFVYMRLVLTAASDTALAAVHVIYPILFPPAAAAAAAVSMFCPGCSDTLHAVQLSTLIGELASAGEAELGVQLDDGVQERLLAYSRSVASFPTAVKEVSLLQDITSSSIIGSLSHVCDGWDQVVARC